MVYTAKMLAFSCLMLYIQQCWIIGNKKAMVWRDFCENDRGVNSWAPAASSAPSVQILSLNLLKLAEGSSLGVEIAKLPLLHSVKIQLWKFLPHIPTTLSSSHYMYVDLLPFPNHCDSSSQTLLTAHIWPSCYQYKNAGIQKPQGQKTLIFP